MGSRIFKNQQLNQITLDESSIFSIKWVNENGIDLEMEIDWCGQEDLKDEIDFLNVVTKLVFQLVSDIDFNFKHNDIWTIGALEITNFSFNKLDERYSVEFRFDFQPIGHIKFNCNELYFEVIQK
jgi:hypothetical protein